MGITEYLKESGATCPLFIQMYSMRSHENGKYYICFDGNFDRLLHDIYPIRKQFFQVFITVPNNTDEWHLANAQLYMNEIFGVNYVTFVPIEYGENAHESRLNAASMTNMLIHAPCDIIVNDFERNDSILSTRYAPVVYRWNVTWHNKMHLTGLQEFEDDHRRIIASKAPVFVLNDIQRQYFAETMDVTNVHVSKGWFNLELLEKTMEYYDSLIPVQVRYELEIMMPESFLLFMNRPTDKEYRLSYICNHTEKQVVIIDINDSVETFTSEHKNLLPIQQLVPSAATVNTRSLYLWCILNRRVIVPYLQNPQVIIHQTILELIGAQKLGCAVRISDTCFRTEDLWDDYAYNVKK